MTTMEPVDKLWDSFCSPLLVHMGPTYKCWLGSGCGRLDRNCSHFSSLSHAKNFPEQDIEPPNALTGPDTKFSQCWSEAQVNVVSGTPMPNQYVEQDDLLWRPQEGKSLNKLLFIFMRKRSFSN